MKCDVSVSFPDGIDERGTLSKPAQEVIVGDRTNGSVLTLSNSIVSAELEGTIVIYQSVLGQPAIPLIYRPYGSESAAGSFTINPEHLNQIILVGDQMDNVRYFIFYRKSV